MAEETPKKKAPTKKRKTTATAKPKVKPTAETTSTEATPTPRTRGPKLSARAKTLTAQQEAKRKDAQKRLAESGGSRSLDRNDPLRGWDAQQGRIRPVED